MTYKTPPYVAYAVGSTVGAMYGVEEATGWTFWVLHGMFILGIAGLMYLYDRSKVGN